MNPRIQNHESMLRESIKHFLTSHQSGSSDYSSFESIFFRLIQTMLDPPLEFTWFYSAVTFHAAKSSSKNNDPPARVVAAKDLLNLLISCSNLSSGSKKIALLAPVVYELYNILCDSRSVKMDVEKLVNHVISYITMSASLYDYENGDVKCHDEVVCFEDLVRVWTIDRGGGSCNFIENLRAFFPLLSDGIWKWSNRIFGVRELVGIVLCEAFFLRLYLSFGSGVCREVFLKDAQDQTVQTIKGFVNSYFLDILFKMLLEPSLPVASLLCPEDAVILYKALYDSVLLVEYSFCSRVWAQSNDCQSKTLALLWVLVAERAIRFARAKNDRDRAALYLGAFRESHLVSELVEWASIRAGVVDRNDRPDVTSPGALIQWLFALEDQGIRVFDHSLSLLHAKSVSKVQIQGTNGDLEMGDPLENGYPDGLGLTGRKRKESGSGSQESRIAQVRRVSGHEEAGFRVYVINISSSDDNNNNMES